MIKKTFSQFLQSKEQLLTAVKMNPIVTHTYELIKYGKVSFDCSGEVVDINFRPKMLMYITWMYDINIDTTDVDDAQRSIQSIKIEGSGGVDVITNGFFNKTPPQIQQWMRINTKLKK